MSPIKVESSVIVGAVQYPDVKPSVISLIQQSGNTTRTRRRSEIMLSIMTCFRVLGN